LAVVPFGPDEIDTILGGNEYETRLLAANFNWIAAYLCEEAGLFEEEVAHWFRSEAKGLGGKNPLSVWRTKEGFWKVFEYAQLYKQQVEEDMGGEDLSDPNMFRASGIAENALGVILNSFEVAGVDISPCEEDPNYIRSRALHNPNRDNSPLVRWKGCTRMEDFRVTIDEGPREATFFIVRCKPENEEPFILQTGIGRHGKMLGENQGLDIDSDLDGRPPSAGEIASFVIPVANETHNRTLKPIPV
jgi:hypothetical protein